MKAKTKPAAPAPYKIRTRGPWVVTVQATELADGRWKVKGAHGLKRTMTAAEFADTYEPLTPRGALP